MGRIVAECIAETPPGRPFLDTEHGPIHAFKDRRITLAEAFDDEYFRHMAWAHLASGGAGGGMRWPNRSPHVLTSGMRAAQRAMSAFMPLIDWTCFKRRNLAGEAQATGFHTLACADKRQAVVWLLRRGATGSTVIRPSGGYRKPLPGDHEALLGELGESAPLRLEPARGDGRSGGARLGKAHAGSR